mmetsp:Transcript_33497/g.96769  ORF Transcript_33497/g.96769 Transcript_33497/m.96769 type:complete len:242 (+) Transcript_33497:595-1320(+)
MVRIMARDNATPEDGEDSGASDALGGDVAGVHPYEDDGHCLHRRLVDQLTRLTETPRQRQTEPKPDGSGCEEQEEDPQHERLEDLPCVGVGRLVASAVAFEVLHHTRQRLAHDDRHHIVQDALAEYDGVDARKLIAPDKGKRRDGVGAAECGTDDQELLQGQLSDDGAVERSVLCDGVEDVRHVDEGQEGENRAHNAQQRDVPEVPVEHLLLAVESRAKNDGRQNDVTEDVEAEGDAWWSV